MKINTNKIIQNHFFQHLEVIKKTYSNLFFQINKAADLMVLSIKKKGTIFWCGNGGSASDSMHLSAELIGRFKKNRKPLKSISLSSNASTLTCISNDFGYENIFSRQFDALAKKEDILVAISTSGNSKNIVNVLNIAKKKRVKTISFLGNKGGKCKNKANLSLTIPSTSTARIQEMHIFIGHILCDLIERKLNL